ncbi:MAG: NAD(P)H-dependent oxidoreductase, partial [Clostridia bacterium]
MKVLMINGSSHKNGCTFTALSEAAKALNEQGIETEII